MKTNDTLFHLFTAIGAIVVVVGFLIMVWADPKLGFQIAVTGAIPFLLALVWA